MGLLLGYLINNLSQIKQQSQNMKRQQINFLLHQIAANCEFLSHIQHQSRASFSHCHQKAKGRELCPVSAVKVIVQMTYLLYTCSVMKLDVYLSCNPCGVEKSQNQLYQVKLLYYLVAEKQQISQDQLCSQCNFEYFRASHFNTRILESITKFVKQIHHLLPEKISDHGLIKHSISKFLQYIKKYIESKLLDNPQLPVIKYLEAHELFARNSDLLKTLKTSIFYVIKKKDEILDHLRNNKKYFLSNMICAENKTSPAILYKYMDRNIYYLIEKQVLYMHRSTTKELKNVSAYFVGDIKTSEENEKISDIYTATFYSIDRNLSQIVKKDEGKLQKNSYILEYTPQNCELCIKYVTDLEARLEGIDIISQHSAQIGFQNLKISIQMVDYVQNPTKCNIPRKYIAFKGTALLEYQQQPFTKFLVLFEYVTICGKNFVQLMARRPSRDQNAVLVQYNRRLSHLMKLFVDKALKFYDNL